MQKKFETVEWAKRSNIYEVNLRQYTAEGSFSAFQQHLPRLKNMGVEVLWFMPVTPISVEKRQGSLGSYYACSNYTTTNPEFGTLEDFKALVNEAHRLGLKVLIDWVANHTGYDHTWTKEHPEFYKRNDAGDFYDQHGWVDVIDLDYQNRELWATMTEAMRFWVETCDIDGFRCDMADLVPLAFWAEARSVLDKQKLLFWLAETEEVQYHQVFDATYAWELLHTMEHIYSGESGTEKLEQVISRYQADFPAGTLRAYFTSNHDENSHSGSEYERLGIASKTFAVLCAFLPDGIPLIYSGQELPNPKRLLFFEKDEISWKDKCELDAFYRTLLQLRKAHPAFEKGSFKRLTTSADDKVYAFALSAGEAQVLVLLSLSGNSFTRFVISDAMVSGNYSSLFSGLEFDLSSRTFELQMWEYLVYVKYT